MKKFNFQKRNWKFLKAKLEESKEMISNPGCGWYQIYSFHAEKLPDYDEIRPCLNEDEKLVLVIINIGEYKNQELDQKALLNIDGIISFFANEKKDIILRLVYDNIGKGLEQEPLTLARIEAHMRTLRPVFYKYNTSLFIVQGMFIGSWGEMHTSKFLSEECLERLYRTLLSVTDDQTFLAVRRPMFWRMLESSDKKVRLGLFNDGLLATESHLGTFGQKNKGEARWKEAWCAEDELDFIEQLCRNVPHGGEAVLGEMSDSLSSSETIEFLKKMHISYLNSAHDKRLLNKWKSQTWLDGTMYEYIGAHLGYRFVVKDTDMTFPRSKNVARLQIYVENVGFSNCYEEGVTTVIVKTSEGKCLTYEVKSDIRRWNAGEIHKLMIEIPLISGKIYIKTIRKKDNEFIRYAQKEEYSYVYLGEIQKC